MAFKRVSLFMGHYGSGKTHLAVNYALHLRKMGYKTAIADLDIVNPYFRTRDSAAALIKQGVALISSPFAGSNVDLPALPQEMYAIIHRRDTHFVVDVGGDDRGALALGRLTGAIKEEGDYEAFFVVNFYRPLTKTPQDAYDILREVEAAAHLQCTSIINCSNVGEETTKEDILATQDKVRALCALSHLPLAMTAVLAKNAHTLDGELEHIFPLSHFNGLHYKQKEG